MKLLIVILLLTAILSASPAQAQSLGATFSTTDTPEDVARWISGEFTYVIKAPDEGQTVNETLRSRTGDCDDLAFLAKAALENLRINAQVVVIRFEGLNILHAICIWKSADDTYDFFSSRRLHRTRQRSVRAAVALYYPDWKKITLVNERREPVRVLARAR